MKVIEIDEIWSRSYTPWKSTAGDIHKWFAEYYVHQSTEEI